MKVKILRNMKVLLVTFILLFGAAQTYAQSANVKGVVSDKNGETLVGVNIMIKGTTIGTLSGVDGSFELKLQNPKEDVLVFSFVGYKTQEIVVEEQNNLAITMESKSEVLDEVVIVGYGVQRKSDLTGSVSTVKTEELTQIATADVAQSLQGRTAGVQVTAQSGEPGAPMKVRIRGVGTINSSDPLYVVDGFPTTDISHIAPNDIERLEVLKDASATAIYGSRGANGVVLITTKGGKAGKTKIEFSAYAGVQEAWNTLDMLNATEYATLRLQAYENDGTTPDATMLEQLNYVIDNNYQGTDWQDEIFTTGVKHNYSLRASGGTEKHQFNVSGTYHENEGIIENSGFEKFMFNLDNSYKFNEWLKAGAEVSLTLSKKNNYNEDLYDGVLTSALRADPVAAAWDPITDNYGRADLSYINNPKRIVDESEYNWNKTQKLLTNIWGEVALLKNLKFRTQFGLDLKNYHNKIFLPQYYISPEEQRSQSSLYEQRGLGLGWVNSNYFNYDTKINKHTFTAMLGMETQYQEWKSFNVTGTNLPESELQHYFSAVKDLEYIVGSGQSEQTLMSYFGRANYNYDSKYLFTATLRYDGSSKFTKDYRWGTFPSFAFGWNVMNEDFMENFDALSNLKVRAGWGQVGNESSVGNYAYITTVVGGQQYTFNGEPVEGIIPTSLSNEELQWETTEMTNIALDAAFLNDRLSLTAEYYIKKTSDMIVYVPIPDYVGASAPAVNAGDMENRGFEFSVNYRNGENELKYDLGFNFSTIENEVTSLGGGEPIAGGNISKVGNTTLTEVGEELAYFYGLETDGIFNTQEELDAYIGGDDNTAIQPNAELGDVKYIDQNGDGVIDDDDRVKLGSGTPDFTYGFNANFEYKNFDLRMFIYGSYGNEIVNAMTRFLESSNGWENSLSSRLDAWTADNPTSNEPRMTNSDLNRNIEYFSDRYVEDGSYIRMKNIQIGYSLPQSTMEKLKFSSMRVYVSIDNLFTITDYSGFDPEIGDLYQDPLYYGVDMGNYPQSRSYMIGVNVGL